MGVTKALHVLLVLAFAFMLFCAHAVDQPAPLLQLQPRQQYIGIFAAGTQVSIPAIGSI